MNFRLITIFALIVFFISFLLQSYKTTLKPTRVINPKESRAIKRVQNGLLKSDKPNEAIKWMFEQRVFPSENIPLDWRERAINHIEKHNLSKQTSQSITWTNVGPFNIGGRVRAIAISNINPNIIYAGSVSGGIFKSTDAGSSWNPITDFAPNLAISSIVINPNNNNIIYAGSGEGFFNYDAVRGDGVLKSTDGGMSWAILKNFTGTSQPAYHYINDLYLRPDSINILYAATNEGLFKTTNSGNNWNFIHRGSSTRATQIVNDPTNSSVFYVCYGNHTMDGIYKTTNGGSVFTKLTGGFPTSGFNRIALAVSKTNPNILFASLDSITSHYTHSIQKSTNGGTTWFSVSKPIDNVLGGSHLGGQGWYNNVIAIHPSNPDIVFAAGINLFKSTNGGQSWSMIAFGYPQLAPSIPYVHVDHHEIEFHPTNSSIIYFGTDGGVFKTTDNGTTFAELNNGFVTNQFYSGAVHPTLDIYYGGTQDNGTLKSLNIPDWGMVFGGDGGATAVDYNNPNIVYTEYIYLNIQKSTNAGVKWVKAMNGIPTKSGDTDGTTDRALFIAPLEMDPNTSSTLVAGTYKVYRTTNSASTWTSISLDLTGDGAGETGSKISAIAIAKGWPSTIYVGTSGSGNTSSRILVTTNTGTTWSNRTKLPLPNRYVSSIAIDESNPNRVWVGYSGYNTTTPSTPGHIFFSSDRGSSWIDISGDLPDIPVNKILINPGNPLNIILGTDLGIFETYSGGNYWSQEINGMANVVVSDLDIRPDGYVFAASHGRGMYKSSTPLTFIIPNDTIFPGDTDDSGIVDSRDLLPIARYYKISGSPRVNASLNWTPQTLRGPFNPIEAAYADCDGNGIVDAADVQGIIQNWYRAHQQLSSPPVNQVIACEELLKAIGDISNSGPMNDIRKEIVRYRSELLNIPDRWILEQNFPNPFNPNTTIRYNSPDEAEIVQLNIYDIKGQLIRSLIHRNILPGQNTFLWDGTDINGQQCASGIYFYSLISKNIQLTNKMILAK